MQCARAEMASLRNTRPGMINRMGGSRFSISRTWTELVWVRNNTSGLRSTKNVSCMSRAGCSGGKLRPLNTCQSSSISGPSATANPMFWKMSTISRRTTCKGWWVPIGTPPEGRVASRPEALTLDADAVDAAFTLSSTACFSALSIGPSSRFWSPGTSLKAAMRSFILPFRPR